MKHSLQTRMFTKSLDAVVFSGAVVLMLSACGGGGGGVPAAPYTPPTPGVTIPSPSGSVSADFVPGSNPRFILASNGRQIIGGSAASSVQSAGAMTTLGNYSLSGSPAVVQDISGDATYAMGRWAWGTVYDASTNPSTQLGTIDASHNSGYWSWHYLLVNYAAAWPASITLTCDNGVFTHPTISGGSISSTLPVTTGSAATLSFDALTKATLSFTLTTTHDTSSNTANYSVVGLTLGSMTSVAGTGGLNASSWILLSDGGGGAMRINGYYSSTLPNGGVYYGVYSFKCQ